MNINYKCLDIQRILRYLRSLSLTSPSILSRLIWTETGRRFGGIETGRVGAAQRVKAIACYN